VINPRIEATAYRLVLSYLQEDPTGADDAVGRILGEVGGDDALEVISSLLRLLSHEITNSGHREAWIIHIGHMLIGPTSVLPDIIDFEP
jgi:hypothetical protein